jgi:hypothetical protein
MNGVIRIIRNMRYPGIRFRTVHSNVPDSLTGLAGAGAVREVGPSLLGAEGGCYPPNQGLVRGRVLTGKTLSRPVVKGGIT